MLRAFFLTLQLACTLKPRGVGKKQILCSLFCVFYTNLFAFISSTQRCLPPLRASLWSSCVVLPLLALTWMSAVLAMTDKRSILFQILFAVFDSLQGFVIVMVHCILRREVEDDLMFAGSLHIMLLKRTRANSKSNNEHRTVTKIFIIAVQIFTIVNMIKDWSFLFLGSGCVQMQAQKLPRPNQWGCNRNLP